MAQDSTKSSWISELKEFLFNANILDLAVAIIIGIAFGTVVKAMVDGILMPLIAAVVGKPNFDALVLHLGKGAVLYGTFLSAFVNFLIVGVTMFLVVRVAARLKRPKVIDLAESGPTEMEVLKEIRDLLATRSTTTTTR